MGVRYTGTSSSITWARQRVAALSAPRRNGIRAEASTRITATRAAVCDRTRRRNRMRRRNSSKERPTAHPDQLAQGLVHQFLLRPGATHAKRLLHQLVVQDDVRPHWALRVYPHTHELRRALE